MKFSQDSQRTEPMETDNNADVSTREILIFMEFDKKMKDYLLDNKIFFRMTRIEDKPFVQMNSHIFKGEYRSCIGTNLFFSDYDKQEPGNLFRDQGSIRLKHVATQFKTLILNPVRIPSNLADLPRPLYDIEVNDKCDNKTLLRKFAYGSLDLKEDLIVVPRKQSPAATYNFKNTNVIGEREKPLEIVKQDSKVNIEENQTKHSTETVKELRIDLTSTKVEKTEVTVDILTHKFRKLKRLAMRPTRRRKETEPIEECDEKYKKAYDYNCLKSAIIKPSDFFRTITETFNEKTLVGAVDVDRSVLQGVIDPSTQLYRILTEEEKLALLSIKNLENLSMAARYRVIKSHLDHLNSSVVTLSKDGKTDACGRTIEEKINVYDRLVRVLGGIITQQYCYDSDIDDKST